MTDPRKQLTEEIPETPEDFKNRQLTEVGGEIKADRSTITEDLPQEEDEEAGERKTLLG
jgi:hypothetical protein